MTADDESQRRMFGLERRDPLVLPEVQVRHADDEIGALRLECPDRALGDGQVIVIDLQVIARVAAVFAVQRQREQADRLAIVHERDTAPEDAIRRRVTRSKGVIVAKPVEPRGMQRIDEVIRGPRVEFVITRDGIERRQPIEEIHGVDHLQAVPELALERGIQEVAAMQDADVAALALKLARQRNDAAEAAGVAILDGADPVGVIEVQESESRCRCRGGDCATGNAEHDGGE